MKKMISMILTAALLLTAFTGCSREAEPQNTQPEPPVEQSAPEVSEEEQSEMQPDEQGESQERNDSLSGEKQDETEDELSMEKPSEQEEAEEILDVSYPGTELEIGFNVSYVLDVLNALKCENVRILLTDSVSSVQIEDAASQSAAYVVMPMRL